jgi:hypothetical protein
MPVNPHTNVEREEQKRDVAESPQDTELEWAGVQDYCRSVRDRQSGELAAEDRD